MERERLVTLINCISRESQGSLRQLSRPVSLTPPGAPRSASKADAAKLELSHPLGGGERGGSERHPTGQPRTLLGSEGTRRRQRPGLLRGDGPGLFPLGLREPYHSERTLGLDGMQTPSSPTLCLGAWEHL